MSTKRLVPVIAAVLCLTWANTARAADDSTLRPGYSTKSTMGEPAKFNKASGLIGMDVRNQNDEHLGHIKDVVFDLKTERVAYAVLSTAPKATLGINEKLLAVPLNAFTVSADQKHLILNADKNKVEAAMGIDKDNWPSVSNPSWGAQPFWEKSGTRTEPVLPNR